MDPETTAAMGRLRVLYPKDSYAGLVRRAIRLVGMDSADLVEELRERTITAIVTRHHDGQGPTAIARTFNEAGVRTLSGRGSWDKGTVHKIVREHA